ncbi:MAG TPA: T9SS type A sorting domain-containing protein [Saprospiraceae bacterium]|nr:T9SS type A sorting domain-containing protein [Saprospiraceae bacterium]
MKYIVLITTTLFLNVDIASSQKATIVDHNSLHLFDQIPEEYLEAARNLKMVWINRSVGGNIDQGLDCFSSSTFFGQTQPTEDRHPAYCRRYYTHPDSIGFQQPFKTYSHTDFLDGLVPEPILHHPNKTKYDRSNWKYEFWGDDPNAGSTGQWFNKVEYFLNRAQTLLQTDPDLQVLSFQFSYLEVDGSETPPIESPMDGYFSGHANRKGYLDVEVFADEHPQVTVMHWTSSLALVIGTPQATTFNQQMRQFAIDNGKYLLDAAAILSHDPNGIPCFGINSETQNDPAICPHYTTEQFGGHLGSVSAGMIRMGKAMWIMMARIAGWNPDECQDEDIHLYNLPIPAGNYSSNGNILSNGIILENTEVIFKAGDSIYLLPGFHSQEGSTFHAIIESCEPASMPNPSMARVSLPVSPIQKEHTDVRIFPNPFQRQATIEWELAQEEPVDLRIFDLTGRQIKILHSGQLLPYGKHQFLLNDNDLPTGIWLLRLQAGQKVITKKILKK